ncbi:MAG: M28 family peptidase [Candidatus Kapabacteria bacterium]|jgi:aminopeptidase YwaD|nr:M28 family peptidase [Candidatus Kapabacteria bacterium]
MKIIGNITILELIKAFTLACLFSIISFGTLTAQAEEPELIINEEELEASEAYDNEYSDFIKESDSPMVKMLKEHVIYLASDKLQGRLLGTVGNLLAEDYIVKNFELYGLQQVNASFKQTFDYAAGINPKPACNTTFHVVIPKPGIPKELLRKRDKKWMIEKHWRPMRFSANGTITDAELVFVGYGVTASELSYDDYAGIDVKGKVVIVLADSAEGKPLDDYWKPYSELTYKAENAEKHGAAGIIYVKTLSDSSNTYYTGEVKVTDRKINIPAIQAKRSDIARMFSKKLPLLKLENNINASKKPQSMVLPNISVSIVTDIETKIEQFSNIVGIVKGSDPAMADEYIVVGAHLDGIGWGKEFSKLRWRVHAIHNGADDNASGVAIMTELAAILVKNPPKRSVLFVAFNGEEKGLMGSKRYFENPIVPSEKTIAMIDLNMLGRLNRGRINIFGINSGDTFAAVTDTAAAHKGFKIDPQDAGSEPSDCLMFLENNIPAMHFFTYMHVYHHTHKDDPNFLHYTSMEKIVGFTESVVRNIADAAEKPRFIK